MMALAPEHWGWPRLVEQAAAMGLSRSRLYRLVEAGECPAEKDGREWHVDPGWCAAYARTRQGKFGQRRKRKGKGGSP